MSASDPLDKRPRRADMSEQTRALHEQIDSNIKRLGFSVLHPSSFTLQQDLFHSKAAIDWQERKASLCEDASRCWSELPQVYARYGTSHGHSLICALKQLEHARGVILFDSGMQAICTLLDFLVARDDHIIVSRHVYNKTTMFAHWLCERVGAKLTLIEDTDAATIRDAARENSVAVFCETFSNPLMRALNLKSFSDVTLELRNTKCPRLKAIVDSTIATPWAFRNPILSYPGINFVLGSGTKALGGQDCDMWGYLASNSVRDLNSVMDIQAMRGGGLDWRRSEAIFQRLPQAESYFRRRCKNAQEIARYLQVHPVVEAVYHPSLSSGADAEALTEQYCLCGSIVSFRLAGVGEADTQHFCDVLASTEVVRYALSFDGLTTKVNHHQSVSEYYTDPSTLEQGGLARVVRLAVGIEDVGDIIKCLEWALACFTDVSAETLEQWRKKRLGELELR